METKGQTDRWGIGEERKLLRSLRVALGREDPNLKRFPETLAQQIVNRLAWGDGTEAYASHLANALSETGRRWLRLRSPLPDSSLHLATLVGHQDAVLDEVDDLVFRLDFWVLLAGVHDN